VAALYEQGKISHCGLFTELEDQLTGWDASTSNESPDRLDALVHGFTELMLRGNDGRYFTREQVEACLVDRRPREEAAKSERAGMRRFDRG
jgi:hypothetical protein